MHHAMGIILMELLSFCRNEKRLERTVKFYLFNPPRGSTKGEEAELKPYGKRRMY